MQIFLHDEHYFLIHDKKGIAEIKNEYKILEKKTDEYPS